MISFRNYFFVGLCLSSALLNTQMPSDPFASVASSSSPSTVDSSPQAAPTPPTPPTPPAPHASPVPTPTLSGESSSASTVNPVTGQPEGSTSIPQPETITVPAPMPVPSVPTPNPVNSTPVPSVPATPENPADALTLTEKSMSLVEGDVATRTQLIDKAAQLRSDAQLVVTRLEAHKDTWYERYLALDGKLDAFYEETGLSRGHLEDDVEEITDVLVEQGLANNNANDEQQEKVKAYEAKVDELGSQIRKVAASEKTLLDSVRKLSDRTDSALDISTNIKTMASGIRGLAKDEDAQAQVKKITESVEEINGIEKELESDLIPTLDKAFIDISTHTKKVTDSVAELKGQGVAFAEYTKQVVEKREELERAIEKKSEKSANDNNEPVKKKKKNKKTVSFKSDGLVGVTTHYAYEAYIALKPAITMVGVVVFEIAQAFKRAWVYIVNSLHQEEEKSFLSKIDSKVKDDAVLEKIRQQRNESYRKMQEAASLRKITKEKEEELDRLEYQRRKELGLPTTPLEEKLDSDDTLFEQLRDVFERLMAGLFWLFEFLVGLIKAIFSIEK